MSPPFRVIAIVLAGLAALLIFWQVASARYLQPRAELLRELEELTNRVGGWETTLEGRPQLQRELRAIESRTLGGDLETADHQLRSRLNRLTEAVGLSGATVGTGSAAARQTPARQMFRGTHPSEREARDMIDFVELEGSISGEGSLEQIVALIDRIEAEPWIKRIDSVRIDPRRTGERFGVTLRLSTLFMPGTNEHSLAGAKAENPADPYDPSRLARYASLVESNPFRVPPREQPRRARPAEPASFPFAQWLLTGVAEGAAGPEAWLRNSASGERMVLLGGQRLDEAVFVGISGGDQAKFEIGESQFLVAVGGSLADRTPVMK